MRESLFRYIVNNCGENQIIIAADLDNLPSPDVLADDIIENLQSALESFENLKEQLK